MYRVPGNEESIWWCLNLCCWLRKSWQSMNSASIKGMCLSKEFLIKKNVDSTNWKSVILYLPWASEGKHQSQWLEVGGIWSLTQYKELFDQPDYPVMEWAACPEMDFFVVSNVWAEAGHSLSGKLSQEFHIILCLTLELLLILRFYDFRTVLVWAGRNTKKRCYS